MGINFIYLQIAQYPVLIITLDCMKSPTRFLIAFTGIGQTSNECDYGVCGFEPTADCAHELYNL